MLATKLGAVHVPDSDNVAEIKVGDALEVEKMDEENKKSKSKAFQIPPEKDLRGRIVSALGAPTSASGFQSISEAYLSEQSGENLEAILRAVIEFSEVMESIEVASAEHANGINQVNKAIMDMDRLTQENAMMVEQSAAASEQMASQADR